VRGRDDPEKKSGQALSFCDFNLFRELGLQIILAFVGAG
jgi:hypothetical protein